MAGLPSFRSWGFRPRAKRKIILSQGLEFVKFFFAALWRGTGNCFFAAPALRGFQPRALGYFLCKQKVTKKLPEPTVLDSLFSNIGCK